MTGLYHLVNNTKISKFDLISQLNLIFKNNKTNISPKSDYKADKSLINSRNDFNYLVPSYITMIKEMKKWMITYHNLYKHYDF